MSRRTIFTEQAPRAIGPYSQGVQVGNLVFTAGQTGVDPATGQLVAGGIVEQTRQALRNVQAILEAAGCSLADVAKTTVFLTDMNDFQAMNGVYAEFFPVAPPARSTVQVGALPLGARIEIEAVAFKPIEDKQG
ncbi:MAG: RidA family protein [Anaerolineae bacterium]|nr:RidA family protein [Anaerolineae bacterium]MDW8071974.1 RidA family protein [Anaerolineae bacterium]